MSQRRDFIKTTLGAAGAVIAGSAAVVSPAAGSPAAGSPAAGSPAAGSPADLKKPGKNKFKLDYAPHIGMFENSAGKDPIDQLKFMADMGFPAMEDNGMMGAGPGATGENGQ